MVRAHPSRSHFASSSSSTLWGKLQHTHTHTPFQPHIMTTKPIAEAIARRAKPVTSRLPTLFRVHAALCNCVWCDDCYSTVCAVWLMVRWIDVDRKRENRDNAESTTLLPTFESAPQVTRTREQPTRLLCAPECSSRVIWSLRATPQPRRRRRRFRRTLREGRMTIAHTTRTNRPHQPHTESKMVWYLSARTAHICTEEVLHHHHHHHRIIIVVITSFI